EDNTVTIRDRDDLSQIRVSIDELKGKLKETTSMESLLRKL
ncbi:MAG: glycyl-tRNA synthetase, partial [Roseivirga sp.]